MFTTKYFSKFRRRNKISRDKFPINRQNSLNPTTLNQKEFLNKGMLYKRVVIIETKSKIPPPPLRKQSNEPFTAAYLLSKQNISKRGKTN